MQAGSLGQHPGIRKHVHHGSWCRHTSREDPNAEWGPKEESTQEHCGASRPPPELGAPLWSKGEHIGKTVNLIAVKHVGNGGIRVW